MSTMSTKLQELKGKIDALEASAELAATKRAAAATLGDEFATKLEAISDEPSDAEILLTQELLDRLEKLKALKDAPKPVDVDDEEEEVKPATAPKPKAAPTRLLSPIEKLEAEANAAREQRARAKQAIIDAGKAYVETGKRIDADFERRLQELRKELADRRKAAEDGHLNDLERFAALADDANNIVQAKKKEIEELKRQEAQAEADRRKAETEAAERRQRLLALAARVQASGDIRATTISSDPPPAQPAQTATPTTTAAPAATPAVASNGTSGQPSLRERVRAFLMKK
jgi:chromosome segregation ATPase